MSDFDPNDLDPQAEERPIEVSDDGEIIELVSPARHYGYRVTGRNGQVEWVKRLGEALPMLARLNSLDGG